MDIWGKVILSHLRGRFFGYRQIFGGLLPTLKSLINCPDLEESLKEKAGQILAGIFL